MKKAKENSYKIFFSGICLIMHVLIVTAQDENVYKSMSLDELLSVDVVVTASKVPEDLFETPLSVTIITREEIDRSGAINIPEVLRLAPGLIVREITPGNYDVHIRGYDDITKNYYMPLPFNNTMLVMIDNRIVYSYYTGGTFWETFPIDINDVKQIEVVRGPAASLYGANAVTGVINIITSHADKKGVNAYAQASLGNNNAKKASVNFGYNWNDKTKLSFSSNFTERYRFDTNYYDFNTKSYTSTDNLTMILAPVKDEITREVYTFKEFREKLGPWYDEDLSLRRIGGNIFLSHNFSEQSNIDIAVGAQKSQSQKVGFLNSATALSFYDSKSYYFNTKIKHHNFSGQFNINTGEDFSNYKFNSYKFTNMDMNVEYYKEVKNFSFRPGINYKSTSYNSPVTYNETLYLNSFNFQFKDEPRVTSSYAASILTEWKPTTKLRFIGSARVDKFDMNTNYFTSYEMAATYRYDKNNLFRLVFSSASKSPFNFDAYLNTDVSANAYSNAGTNTTITVPLYISTTGTNNLIYPTNTNQEIGWRTKINSNLSLDVELFYSNVNNFVNPNLYRQMHVVQQLDASGNAESIISIDVTGDFKYEKYDLKAQQMGASFNLNYNLADNFKARVYATFQNTKISGRTGIDFITTSIRVGEINPDNTRATDVSSIANPTQWSADLTPSLFGGFVLNYEPDNKWNINMDAYFYTNQEFAFYNYFKTNDETDILKSKVGMNINSNIVINAKASYQLTKNLSPNITIKNLFGNHYEYGFADPIGTTLLLGFQWKY